MKSFKFTINGTKYNVDIENVEGQNIQLKLNDKPFTVEMEEEVVQPTVVSKPVTSVATSSASGTQAGGGTIKSPLPGVIIDVLVKVGDAVTSGQNVILLEAMKMENNIHADKTGTVTEIKVNKGDSIMEGDVLLVIG